MTAPNPAHRGPGVAPDPDRSALARWFDGLGPGQRVFVVALAVLVVVNLALAGTRSLVGGQPGGPTSSSFSTGGDGLEGYADLLRSDGRSVERVRRAVTTADLPAGATAVVADPEGLTAAEARRLIRFVAGGGRLVVAGERAAPLLEAVTGVPVRWGSADAVDEMAVWVPVDGTGSARALAGDRGGRWAGFGGLVPVAGTGDRPAVVIGPIGDGRVVALADAAPLQNADLGRADNAAFALAAAGGRDRPVVFVESVHGYAATGISAVPPSWKWVAAGLVLALVAGLWSAGTRLGPPEAGRRELRPPRRAHVEAVAAGLDRVTSAPAAAAEPLLAANRAALATHLGVAPDASPAVLYAAAERSGVDPRDVEVVSGPVTDLPAALAVGALAARRQRARHHLVDPLAAAPGTVTPHPDSPGASS